MSGQNSVLKNCVRILVFFTKNPLLSDSDEEFERYRLDIHARAFAELVEDKKGKGLVRYEQLHINSEEQAKLKAWGLPVLEGYDGIDSFDFESLEQFHELWSCPEYASNVVPEEKKFMIRETALVLCLSVASLAVVNREPKNQPVSVGIRQDRARMLFGFRRKEGMRIEEMKEHWVEHARLACEDTRMGQEVTKYDRLIFTAPDMIKHVVESSAIRPLPEWDGLAQLDAPSFEAFKHPEDAEPLNADVAKWQAVDKMFMLPVNVATIITNYNQ
ncbi:hypothetical protein VNI00_004474 [Paramarasmius palmivorus]|uniref:EthD domain-containing protein n=1 Tax=Paramarasmius palmivorus TaxID=297713 RepID=A0AAW0DHS5_9AGAR